VHVNAQAAKRDPRARNALDAAASELDAISEWYTVRRAPGGHESGARELADSLLDRIDNPYALDEPIVTGDLSTRQQPRHPARENARRRRALGRPPATAERAVRRLDAPRLGMPPAGGDEAPSPMRPGGSDRLDNLVAVGRDLLAAASPATPATGARPLPRPSTVERCRTTAFKEERPA
jgi:hypothetical protein